MDKQIKMHAEYRVEMYGAEEVWKPWNGNVFDNLESIKRCLAQVDRCRLERFGYKFRIAVRLVGDWCEMKENER